MRVSRRLGGWLLALSCLVVPSPAGASATSDALLGATNLSILSATRTVSLDDSWTLESFASANNSLGQSDANFDIQFSPGAAAASALVTWANGAGTATATGAPPDLAVRENAASHGNLPVCFAAAAFSEGLGTLSNFFTVSGTGNVAVQFGIDLAGTLDVATAGCGLAAFAQTIFTLEVDGGSPILFDNRILSIGPASSLSQVFATHLTNTTTLQAGVAHFLTLRVDAESRVTTRLPEPSTAALLILAAGILFWMPLRRMRRAGTFGARVTHSA